MISLLIALVLFGFVVYLFNVLVPLDPRFRAVANAIIGLILFLYVLQALGIWTLPLRLR